MRHDHARLRLLRHAAGEDQHMNGSAGEVEL